jgi:hypothetical protein
MKYLFLFLILCACGDKNPTLEIKCYQMSETKECCVYGANMVCEEYYNVP